MNGNKEVVLNVVNLVIDDMIHSDLDFSFIHNILHDIPVFLNLVKLCQKNPVNTPLPEWAVKVLLQRTIYFSVLYFFSFAPGQIQYI